MPLYEYECTQCGAIEEVLQKFTDKPLTACRQCTGQLRKLISSSTFHLKGSGWYVTDYAQKPKSSSTSSGNDKQAKASGSTTTSGDSKSGSSAE